jgi:hypothetical protein
VSGNTTKYGAAAVDRGLEALFAQRSVPLLGRTINLHDLLAAEVQRLVAANAGHLIARFEASSVSSSVELESQVPLHWAISAFCSFLLSGLRDALI